ncbi:MAG: DinB family protein, partial [Stackebrandtia sp.]
MTTETEALRSRIAAALTEARNRTLALTDAVGESELITQHSPLMSPLVWDFAHIGNQEELWLVRDVGGRDAVRADIDEMYDAFQNPRADRPRLPLLRPDEARDYTRVVRDKVFDILDTNRLTGNRLVAEGFAFGMIAQHEQQHDETMLATHQLRAGPAVLTAPPPPPPATAVDAEVLIPGGSFTMG